jgi:hypothetical protein
LSKQIRWDCALCRAVFDSLEGWREHECRNAMPVRRDSSTFGRFWDGMMSHPTKRMTTAVTRRIAADVGMMEPAPTMPEHVREQLAERNKHKAEIRRGMKKRAKALKRKPQARRKRGR